MPFGADEGLAEYPFAESDRHGFGSCGRTELRDDLTRVISRRVCTDREPAPDFPVGEAICDEVQHLELSRR